ncbi:RuvC family protein [Micromonospora tarensis]|uniref:Holliday junction nuclease RuvC n=1 Tax=Micromonospora tarensis TaxID=2806100 RepID=A0ABS1YD20_9ACTN|nr:hypothetical protein [Micromonospora tarensis]MBM0275131.1 hypothetical protein [Micromonospora tarensis]
MVALDLSTSAAGIAHTHWHDGSPRLGCRTVNTGLIDVHTKIHRVLSDVAAAAKSRPHLVIVEGTFSRPGASDAPLHMLRGVVLHWLWTRQIPYVDVQPATVKVWATGSGATRGENKVTKDRVIEAVLSTYGGLLQIDPRDSDQADAVALLSLGMAAYGQPLVHISNAHQTRALKAPKWPTLSTESGPVVPV